MNACAYPRHCRSASHLEPEHRGIVFLGQEVQKTVGPLSDIPNALRETRQHQFPTPLVPTFVKLNPHEVACAFNLPNAHRANEDAVFPRSPVAVARIERQPGWRDTGYPEGPGQFDAFFPGNRRYGWTFIGAAKTDIGPTVVLAGLDDIDLIATVRPHFAIP